MNEQLAELYQETILEHARHPHNKRELPGANAEGSGKNPICGDEVTLQLVVNDDRVDAACFRGRGCALSQASASMLTDAIIDCPTEQVELLIDRVERLVRGEAGAPEDLGDLQALAGVARVPMRIRCAVLAWKVLRQALGLPMPG